MKIFNFSNHHSISDLLSHTGLLVFTHAINVVIALLQNEKGRIPEVNHFTPVDTSCYLFIFTPQTCYPPSYTIHPSHFSELNSLNPFFPSPFYILPLHVTDVAYQLLHALNISHLRQPCDFTTNVILCRYNIDNFHFTSSNCIIFNTVHMFFIS